MNVSARQEEFIACRYALRQLLARGDGRISEWSLDAPTGRPPELRMQRDPALYLSLSHSHGLIACAVAAQPVGIDIEVLVRKRRIPIDELAQLVCTPDENRQIRELVDERQKHLRFMQFWTLKEAWGKQHGTGIDFALLPQLAVGKVRNSSRVQGVSRKDPFINYARTWGAKTAEGTQVLLSLCTGAPITYWEWCGQCDLHWQDEGLFTLQGAIRS